MIAERVRELENMLAESQRQNEVLMKKLEEHPGQKPKFCTDCKHFIQHYGSDYTEVCCGHCTKLKSLSKRTKENKTCEYFEYGKYR